MMLQNNMEMRPISYKEAVFFLYSKHYSGRKPMVSYAFGWFIEGSLKAVCTFGKPASPTLCVGVCGEKHSESVFELNRVCRTDDLKEPLSKFIAFCLRELKQHNLIIVSYSDTAMNHHGYLYQATNFLYTGKTDPRTDKFTEGNKHQRHYDNSKQEGKRKERSAKHRYVYFCTNNRALKAEWIKSLRYEVQKYPKGENKNYVLGDYLTPPAPAEDHGQESFLEMTS